MYKVYCDEHLLYSPLLDEYAIESPKVTLEVNKVGTFEFTIYSNHPNYDRLQKLKSVIKVINDGKILFQGRIIEDSKGFYNEKNVTCEGDLSYLNDSIVRPFNYVQGISVRDLFTQIINDHNSQVSSDRQFILGNVDNPNTLIWANENYLSSYLAIETFIIEMVGGYVVLNHTDNGTIINYYTDIQETVNQPIQFGENLIDLKHTTDAVDLATAIIPLGAKDDENHRLDIKSVNGGIDYLYDTVAVDKYGWIFKAIEFDDITDANELKAQGKDYLNTLVNLSIDIDIDCVDLANIDANFNDFEIGKNVRVISIPHNLDTMMIINKISMDLFKPESNKINIGTKYASLTEQNQKVNKSLQALYNGQSYLQSQITDQSIIEQGTSGIWTYRKWANGIMEMWGTVNSYTKVDKTDGQMYKSDRLTTSNVNFPFAFTSVPDVSITLNSNYALMLLKFEDTTTNQTGYITVGSATKITETIDLKINYRVIGKWKNI